MKRILSLVLVLVLAFGSMPVFAADVEYGAWLQDAGLLQGDAEGNLNASSALTRAEMMVVLSRLLGVEEDAKAFALASTFTDAEGHWASAYIAYAEANGWSNGMGDGTFGADKALSAEEASTFLLRALGYSPVWGEAVADANALGINAIVSDNGSVSRGEVFELMYDTVMTAPMGSDVILGETLGVVAPVVVEEDALELTSNYALGQFKVVANFEMDDELDIVVTVDGSEDTTADVVFAEDMMSAEVYLTAAASQEDAIVFELGEMSVEGMITDVTKPVVVSAEMDNSKNMTVMFSEDIVLASGQSKVWDDILVDGVKAVGTFTQDATDLNKWVFEFNSSLTIGRHDVEVLNFADEIVGFKIADFAGFVTVVEDITAPYIVSVEYVDQTSVKITFNESVVSGTVTYDGEVADAVTGSDATITVGTMGAIDTYGVEIIFYDLTDFEGNASSEDGIVFNWSAPYETVKPTVVVTIDEDNLLTLVFSEGINEALVIATETDYFNLVDADGDDVTGDTYLFADDGDADTDNTYTLTINKLQDLDPASFTLEIVDIVDASIIENVMADATFEFTTHDEKLPQVSGIVLIDNTADAQIVRITFDEAMDASTIADLDQYIFAGELLSDYDDGEGNGASISVAADAKSVDITIPDVIVTDGIALLILKDVAGNRIHSDFFNDDAATVVTGNAAFGVVSADATGLKTIELTAATSDWGVVTANNFEVYAGGTTTMSATHYVTSAIIDADDASIVVLTLNNDLTYDAKDGDTLVLQVKVSTDVENTFNMNVAAATFSGNLADSIAPMVDGEVIVYTEDTAVDATGHITITLDAPETVVYAEATMILEDADGNLIANVEGNATNGIIVTAADTIEEGATYTLTVYPGGLTDLSANTSAKQVIEFVAE